MREIYYVWASQHLRKEQNTMHLSRRVHCAPGVCGISQSLQFNLPFLMDMEITCNPRQISSNDIHWK